MLKNLTDLCTSTAKRARLLAVLKRIGTLVAAIATLLDIQALPYRSLSISVWVAGKNIFIDTSAGSPLTKFGTAISPACVALAAYKAMRLFYILYFRRIWSKVIVN